jgi:hypothetical protein
VLAMAGLFAIGPAVTTASGSPCLSPCDSSEILVAFARLSARQSHRDGQQIATLARCDVPSGSLVGEVLGRE